MKFLKNHWAAVLCAFVLALLIESPLIVFPFWAKDAYRGINIAHFGTDEHLYLIRAKEALEGHNLGNPAIREGKEENQDYYFSAVERVLTAPARWLGLAEKIDIVNLYNFYNFIGIFILVLLIYFFTLGIGGDKFLALAASAFVIGGYSMIYSKTLFYSDFNIYGRSVYPYVSSLAFFAYLILLIKSLKSLSFRRALFAGILFGFLFYIYFYAWTFALALNGALFLIFVFKKDWPRTKTIFLVSISGLLIGAYNIWRIIFFMNSPAGTQFNYFSWSVYSHAPLFSNLSATMLVLLGLFFYKNKKNENIPLFLAFILAGWVSLNQQVITGHLIQQNHYYWFFIVPLYIIILFYISWFWFASRAGLTDESKRVLKITALVLVLGIVFLNTAVGQYKSFFTTSESKLYEQNYRPLLDILNKDKNSGVVLAADEWPAHLVSIYTSHDLFWHEFAAINYNPIDRIKDALFVYAYLNKESRNDFSGYINRLMQDKKDSSFYKILYQDLEGYWSGFDIYEYWKKLANDDPAITKKRPPIIEGLASEYGALAKDKNNILNILRKYGVNYIIWDKSRNPEWDPTFISGLKEAVSSGNIYLYRVEN